jgi:hypothetical protein
MSFLSRFYRAVAAATLMVVAIALSPVAMAGDQDFTLVNQTGVEIHKLYTSPHSSDEWEEDVLGKDTLDDGESIDVTFGKKEKAAHWDLRVEDEHGTAITWENLNLKEISELTLHYKNGKAWADVK